MLFIQFIKSFLCLALFLSIVYPEKILYCVKKINIFIDYILGKNL